MILNLGTKKNFYFNNKNKKKIQIQVQLKKNQVQDIFNLGTYLVKIILKNDVLILKGILKNYVKIISFK